MVKSPWSITGRQWRWTSREQAACSCAVPLRCGCSCGCGWPIAPVQTDDNRMSAMGNLSIVFLHSYCRENPVPHDAGMTRTGDWDCDAAGMATKDQKLWQMRPNLWRSQLTPIKLLTG